MFPAIGTPAYKNLPFPEQVFLYSLYLNDNKQYCELTGARPKDDELAYLDELVGFLKEAQENPIPEVTSSLPISFIYRHLACYVSYYNPTWFEEGFSPLDELDIKHKRLFGMYLYDFPLVTLDFVSRRCLSYIAQKQPRFLHDVLFYITKMRVAAAEYFKPEALLPETINPAEIWFVAQEMIHPSIATVQDLNEIHPVVDCNEELLDQLDEDTLVIYYQYPRQVKGRSFLPMIPSELYLKEKFYVREWGFLSTGS